MNTKELAVRVVPMLVVSWARTFSLILPGLIESFGLSLAQAGLCVTVLEVGGFLAMLTLSFAMDRWGAIRLLSGCLLLGSVALLLSVVAPSYEVLLLFFFALGAGTASTASAVNALMAATGARRGFYLGIVHSAFGLFSIAAPLVAGAVIAYSGWRAYYGLVGLLGLLVAALFHWSTRGARARWRPPAVSAAGGTALAALRRIGPICLGVSTLVGVQESVGPASVNRFNMFPSSTITGSPMPGFSEGQGVDEIERIAKQSLPRSMGFEWSGVTQQQKAAGNVAPLVFSLALIMVFLFLAAQYESWATPLSVLLSVPLAILGAAALTAARGLDMNIYMQIGLVLLIGLSAKSAILIVEFAKQNREEGKSILESATEAARLRFRPILMTAFSFILGVIPLVTASGAGANSRVSLGTAVFGGMMVATVAGVFLIPVLYVAVQKAAEAMSRSKPEASKPSAPASSPSEA